MAPTPRLAAPLHPLIRHAAPAKDTGDRYQWDRSECLAMAMHNCANCHGSGLTWSRGRIGTEPCRCVLRAIYRVCHTRWVDYMNQPKHLSRVSYDRWKGRGPQFRSWRRPAEEFCADFELIVRRTLTDAQFAVFTLHMKLGADWTVCTRALGFSRGNFFHEVYRIEAKLGRAFRETRPYSLFPIDEYLYGGWAGAQVSK